MNCPICLDNIKDKITIICNHNFCYQCLNEWFENHNTCPICRQELNYLLYDEIILQYKINKIIKINIIYIYIFIVSFLLLCMIISPIETIEFYDYY
jgi:hypothetical protein